MGFRGINLNYFDFKIPFSNHTRLKISAKLEEMVAGINSGLPEDTEHILMWDYDDIKYKEMIHSLKYVQERFRLGDIYVMTDSKTCNFRAICYTRVPFLNMIEILAGTPFIDPDFVRISLRRRYSTIRISPKKGRTPPRQLGIISSIYPSETPPTSVIETYWTEVKA